MEHARPPPELCGNGQMDVNWTNWRQQFLIFLKASGAVSKPTDVKACLLLNLIGPVGQKAMKTFHFDSPKESEDMDILIEKFNEYFRSEVSEIQSRNYFFSSSKLSAETIDQYVNSLKLKAHTCNFGEQTEKLIRDKIILDMKNRKLKKYVLSKPNLNLEELIGLWKQYGTEENLIRQMKSLNVGMKSSTNCNQSNCNAKCIKCGTKHDPEICPAHGKKCGNCGMMHHLTELCTKPAVKMTNKDVADDKTERPKYFNPGPTVQYLGLYRKNI